MPGTLVQPPRTILGDATAAQRNASIMPSPTSAKRRKIDITSSPAARAPGFKGNRGPGSSQVKSQFEETLERMSQNMNNLKENNAEKYQQWERPALNDFNPDKQDLIFQQIEAEKGNYMAKTSIKLFGITENGNSVTLHVRNFLHYLYVAAPAEFYNDDCHGLAIELERQLNQQNQLAQHDQIIQSIQMVARDNIMGYQGKDKGAYLKITVTDERYITRVRSAFEKSVPLYKGFWNNVIQSGGEGVKTFDSIDYVLRFMVDTGVTGMSWVQVPAGKYKLVPQNSRESHCQIEAEVSYTDIIAHDSEGEWAKIAPLRTLSFDIECAGRKGVFPDADVDPVIQIANVVTKAGQTTPFIQNVFVLDTCNPIVNCQVLEFDAEEKLLLAWTEFIRKVDPDVIIGYNIANFDFPYLLKRARHLKVDKFPYLSRTKIQVSKASESRFSSKQTGTRESKTTNIHGRLQLDLLQLVQRDHQLRSYTLNSVCAHFLGEQKEDVDHTMITELHNGTPESRRRLAVYCLKDAYLPQRLMDKLMCLVNYTEMARVTGVPFNFLLAKGQQIKFLSQLFRKARKMGLVIPNEPGGGGEPGGENYTGATVIEPKRAYYKEPIATLDFASLYPSIMQAHNLCYTTLLNAGDDKMDKIRKFNMVEGKDYIKTPNGDYFCTADVKKGTLSIILEELLGARKKAKKELAVETDPFRKAVLNGRQLALKISANSVYGLTGATVGKLPCLAIASSTTAFGRDMIMATKAEVEAHFKIDGKLAEVVYGDTDSVMVKFGTKDLAQTMELGRQAAALVSEKFTKPIKLEFEKVYYPYLLINKKRYAGLYWTKPDKWDKMDTKGIETVRRDNCRMVQTVIETVLNKILIDQDEQGAQDYVKETISDLLQNKIDLSKLVITKALTKESEEQPGDDKDAETDAKGNPVAKPKPPPKADNKSNPADQSKGKYKAKQAHVELAGRMRGRDSGSAPHLGDRVAYVIVKGAAGAKNYEKSEDPIYVLENNIPIDTKYYLENQLAKPLERIFNPILGEKRAAQLLTGEHTRSISVVTPTHGLLSKFTQKTQTCMACKKPLVGKEEANGAVCKDDRPRIGELYQKTVTKLSDLEVRFGRLWTQCQRCQGSLHNEVICSSKDCPIFYMRMKAKKDVEEAGKDVDRFNFDVGAW